MNGISHKQAIQLIHRRLDGLLSEGQFLSLEEHLRSCDSCRAYAAEMDGLSAHLQNQFHRRWDAQPGPSQKVFEQVTAKTRKLPMANRLSSSLKLVGGVAALLLLVMVMNYIVPSIQNTVGSSTPGTHSSLVLKIDPQSCKPASELASGLQPPNELYGYDLVQGTSFVDADFSYEFWLYCDPSLKPDDQQNLNTIAGLGISASWRYDGPSIEGPVQYYYGFDEDDVIGKSGSDGPLYKASVEGAKFGIDLPKTTVQTLIQQGTPIQFQVIVDSGLGQNSGMLSFRLEPTENGVRVLDLKASRSNNSYQGLIAFTAAAENGSLDIYTMRPDGSGLTNLTNSPGNDMNPFWSPDGKYIAFESDRDGLQHIYLMNADSSEVTKLTDEEARHEIGTRNGMNASPWSPDGNKLIFSQWAPGETTRTLYVMEANGENKTPLVSEPNVYVFPAWSSDGEHISFISGDPTDPDGPQLYVVDADGRNLLDVTAFLPEKESLWAYSEYYWSADGGSIFFTAYRHIDEGKDQWIAYEFRLADNQLAEKAVSSTPMGYWREGTSFITGSGGESPVTWLRADGTYGTLKPFEQCESAGEPRYGFTYKRSSHGHLVMAARCPNGDWWLYWANPDGTQVKQLLDSPIVAEDFSFSDVAWSPDDKFIAFNITSNLLTDLYILNVEAALNNPASQPLKVTTGGAGLFYNSSWKPSP